MNKKKLYIMKTRPEISDQEIHEMMDFEGVLKGHKAINNRKYAWPIGIVAIVGIVGITSWYLNQQEPSVTESPAEQPAHVVTDSASQRKQQPAVTETKPKQEMVVEKADHAKPAATKKIESKQESQEKETVTSEYTEAEPVAGYPELYSYFQKELKYPVEALKDSIEGIVSVSFVIDKNGKPDQVKVLNSLGSAFDTEALRVISGMPQWKPATINGKPVAARISMPLTFQITRTTRQ
jgi:TonB family protein